MSYKNIRAFIILLIVVVMFSGCSSRVKEAPVLGETFPYVKFTMLDGSMKSLESMQGKAVVVMFWATWCHKGQQALTRFNDFAATYPRKSSTVFIAVDIDKASESEKVMERIYGSNLTSVQHAFSGNEIADEAYVAFQGDELPFYVVMDRTGKVVHTGNKDAEVFDLLKPPRPGSSKGVS